MRGWYFFICFIVINVLHSRAQEASNGIKIAPTLFSEFSSKSEVVVAVIDSAAFAKWIADNLTADQTRKVTPFRKFVRISGLNGEDWSKLKKSPLIRFIDKADRKPKVEREISAVDLSLNGVWLAASEHNGIGGEGVTVSVKEEPFDRNDIDILGRIKGLTNFPANSTTHATTMVSIIAGAGNSSPEARGIAWEADVAYSDFSNLFPDAETSLRNLDISVQNHSYGVGIENFYGLESEAYDEQCNSVTELLHVFSAGNSGDDASGEGEYSGISGFANLTGQFKMSKNTMSVGAVNAERIIESLSSRGPAYDGRIKPEVVAFGLGGSSEAAAIVSGIAALVQDAYEGANNTKTPSSLVKAVLINTASDAGRPEVDYEYGFGIVNASKALDAIVDERYFLSQLSAGEEKSFVVRNSSEHSSVKVTLVWNDPAALAGTEKALVNDLDLQIEYGAQTALPWCLSSFPSADSLSRQARRGRDDLNNVEQVTLYGIEPGTLVITVKAAENLIGLQKFSLVYDFPESIQILSPVKDRPLLTSSETFVRWMSSIMEAGSAEWRRINTKDWQFISEINSIDGQVRWTTPEEPGLYEVRLVFPSAKVLTKPFVVSRQTDLKVTSHCEDESLIGWNMSSDEKYNIYELGDRYLEKVAQTDNTFMSISLTDNNSRFFAVAPLINGKEGVRSRSVDVASSQYSCYIKSFLQRELVTDSVLLDLELGTVVGVSFIYLERLKGDTFEIVSPRIVKPKTVNFVLHDPDPVSGSNYYRVRVQRIGGGSAVSDLIEVIYTGDEGLFLFPNPVKSGEPVSIALHEPEATFRIFDISGRIISEQFNDGVIKDIDTTQLSPGVYYVRAIAGDKTYTSRFVVY